MVEQEVPFRSKKPDISTEQFIESVHPYTMMFLFLAYEQGAFKSMTELQREIFDRYYTDGLTIEGQFNFIGRQNLENQIKDGFSRIRKSIPDKYNEFFTEKQLPFFKKSDIPFVDDAEAERRKFDSANRSISRMGKKKSEETKRKISLKKIKNWNDYKYREIVLKKMTEVKRTPEFSDRVRATTRKYWEDPNNRKRMSETATEKWKDPIYRRNVLEGIRRARKKRLQEQAKQQGQQ